MSVLKANDQCGIPNVILRLRDIIILCQYRDKFKGKYFALVYYKRYDFMKELEES